jgi:hypothetical protein
MNIDDDPEGVASFVQHFAMTYPVLYAGGSTVPGTYGVEGVPMFIFIDPQGRVTRQFEGFRMDMAEAWEQEFQRLTPAAH